MSSPALQLHDIRVTYRSGWLNKTTHTAVNGVSLSIHPGEVLGLIGESGSGKSTLAYVSAALLTPDAGTVSILGKNPKSLSQRQLRSLRKDFQLVFQDPSSALNPGQTIYEILHDVCKLAFAGNDAQDRIKKVLNEVGLTHRQHAMPAHLSGGEKRRVAVARLRLLSPKLILADEPTTGLDAALKADLIDLILEGREQGCSYLLISHDLPLVAYAADRIAVMHQGQIVEQFNIDEMHATHHPYTTQLLVNAGLQHSTNSKIAGFNKINQTTTTTESSSISHSTEPQQ